MSTEYRKGKVPAPKPRVYTFRDLYRDKVQAAFAGLDVKMEDLTSPEGKAKLQAAKEATAAALGYTEEEAEDRDALEDIFNHLQWAKPRKGEEELNDPEPGSVM